MYDLVVIGGIGYDVNTYPKRDNGKDLTVSQLGGSVIYTAVPASNVSDNVGVFMVVGEDCNESYFTELGIATHGFKKFPGKCHRFHHTYLSEDGQERTFKGDINPNIKLDMTKFPKEYLGSPRADDIKTAGISVLINFFPC